MARQHAGRCRPMPSPAGDVDRVAQQPGDAPRARLRPSRSTTRLGPGDVDDGDSRPMRPWAAVEDQRDALAQIGGDMRCRGRADMARAVGAGRGDGQRRPRAAAPARPGWAGTRTATVSSPARRQIGDAASGPRPAPASAAPARTPRASRAPAPVISPSSAAASQPGDMHDQRVEARPSLGLEDGGHGPAVGGIGAEPVHRLGRKRDQRAGARQEARPPSRWPPTMPLRCPRRGASCVAQGLRLITREGRPLEAVLSPR